MDKEVKVIGLTGGIGTGKSTAASFLKEKGFAHVDADEISRGLTADGSPMLAVLDKVFGPRGEMGTEGVEILNADGSLDRKGLAAIVFTDENKRKKLDELMFGSVIEEIDAQIKAAKHDKSLPGILLDVPLLFEAGLEDRCDTVVLMVADMDIRIARVCKRDGATPEEVVNRIKNQMSDDEKIAGSDVIVDNSDGLDALLEKLQQVYISLTEKKSVMK